MPEQRLTPDQQLDLEGVPPQQNGDDRRTWLTTQSEVFEWLDALDQQGVSDHSNTKKLQQALRSEGIPIEAAPAPAASKERVTPTARDIADRKKPNVDWMPEEYQQLIASLEQSFERPLLEAALRWSVEMSRESYASFDQLLGEFRKRIAELPHEPDQLQRVDAIVRDIGLQLHQLVTKYNFTPLSSEHTASEPFVPPTEPKDDDHLEERAEQMVEEHDELKRFGPDFPKLPAELQQHVRSTYQELERYRHELEHMDQLGMGPSVEGLIELALGRELGFFKLVQALIPKHHDEPGVLPMWLDRYDEETQEFRRQRRMKD